MCAPRVRSSQPRCASRGPNRSGAATKLSTPTGPTAADNKYVNRQPGARPRPRGWAASSRCPHCCRTDAVSANTSRTSPSSDKLPENTVCASPDTSPDGSQPRGGPDCAGGRDRPNCSAKRGNAFRADDAHNSPRPLRQSSRSHSPRPRAARDSAPRHNSWRSHSTDSGWRRRSPIRTDLFYTEPRPVSTVIEC